MTIENSTASATQWGISSASVVLEALTEAGMATELCLVYPALAATPKVGPVAAGQDIYWRLLVGQQPLPVQRGGGQFDQNYLDYYSIRAVDALEAGRTAFDCGSEWSNAPLWYTSVLFSASALRDDGRTYDFDLSMGGGVWLNGGHLWTITWTQGQDNTLLFYDADGRTMNIKAGTSYIALVTSVTGQELTVTNSSGEEILG